MRIILLVAAVVTAYGAAPLGAQASPPTCKPSTPPTDPNSEEGNPGFGGTTGLNEDFHNDDFDPLDRPGQVIGPVNRDLAQSGEPGGNHLLRDFVGNDCPKE